MTLLLPLVRSAATASASAASSRSNRWVISGDTSRPSRIASRASLISSTNRYAPTQVISRVTRSPSTADTAVPGRLPTWTRVPPRAVARRTLPSAAGAPDASNTSSASSGSESPAARLRTSSAPIALATASEASDRSAATTDAAPRYLAAATTSDPIGPGAVDDDVAAAHVARPVHRVQGDGERFGERAVLGAHAVGQRADLVGPHHPQLAEPAVGVRVERRRAEVADPRVEVGAPAIRSGRTRRRRAPPGGR